MIKLFGTTDKIFLSNGDIVINPIKAKVTKKDNSDYYLDLECGLEFVDYLTEGNIIIANTPQGEQAFRITNPQKTRSKVTVKAWHVFFDSKNYLIADTNIVDKNGSQALNQLNTHTEPQSEFTTDSDVSKIDSFRCVRMSLYEAIMTLVERWGGHLVRDNFDIQLVSDISQDNGITVQYAKNLREITVEENWDDVVTKILPVGKDGILLNEVNPSASIYISSSTQYDIPYTKTVSFEQEIEQDDYPTETAYKTALVNDLRTQATSYLEQNCVPHVNYTLKAHLDRVTDIGDIIHVRDERLGLNLLTSVISYTWDCLLERYDEVEFGNFKPTLTGLIPTITAGVNKRMDYALSGKQNTLVSGTNIKTINGQSVMGSGDIVINPSVLDCYPVGSYYETSDASFDPNVSWGGTWVLEEQGRVHVSSGQDYSVGATGGEKEHVLTVDEMPSHAHDVTFYYRNTVTYSSGSNARPYSKDGSLSTKNWADASNTGGGQAHNNMPPYIVVNRWHRTA